MLVKDPTQRYSTGGEFAAAVAAVRRGERLPAAGLAHRAVHAQPRARPILTPPTPAAKRPTPTPRPAPPPRRPHAAGHAVLAATPSADAQSSTRRRPGGPPPRSPPGRWSCARAPGAGARCFSCCSCCSPSPPWWSASTWCADLGAGPTPQGMAPGTVALLHEPIRPPISRVERQSTPRPQEPAAMTTPRLLSERYELGEVLGFGGMSEVHRGLDTRLGRDVAVKVLRADLARDPQFQMRFRREAQNAAALNHPAIVAVYDTGEVQSEFGPLPYIVMEYVDGQTLREIVKTTGPMSQQQVLDVMADVCAALDFSHRHQIIHRDVKPANIMINRAGAVKVMDFGIARALGEGQNVTQTAAVIGTAQYLRPSRRAARRSTRARTSTPRAACSTSCSPGSRRSPATPPSPWPTSTCGRTRSRRRRSTRRCRPRWTPSCSRRCRKNPANRYQSAAEMRSDLVRVRSGQAPLAPAVHERRRAHRDDGSRARPPAPPAGSTAAACPRPRRPTTATTTPTRSRRGAPGGSSPSSSACWWWSGSSGSWPTSCCPVPPRRRRWRCRAWSARRSRTRPTRSSRRACASATSRSRSRRSTRSAR